MNMGHLRRIAISFLISVLLNGILVSIDFSINPRQAHLSTPQNIAVMLLRPAEALMARFVPGHGGAQIVALVGFSIIIYALVAWLALSLPTWWRYRT